MNRVWLLCGRERRQTPDRVSKENAQGTLFTPRFLFSSNRHHVVIFQILHKNWFTLPAFSGESGKLKPFFMKDLKNYDMVSIRGK